MKQKDPKLLFVDWVLLFALNFSMLLCLQRAYNLVIAAPMITATLLLTGVFCTIFRLPRTWIAAVSALAAMLFVFFLFRSAISESFGLLYRLIVDRLSGSYLWVDQILGQNQPVGAGDLSPAMLMLTAVMCYLSCASVVWLRSMVPCVLWCVVAISPCFFLTDLPLNVPMLVLFSATLLVLAFSQGVRSRAPQEAVRATLFAMLPAALLVGLLLLFFPADRYTEPPVSLTALSEQFRRLGEKADAEINLSGSTEQGVELRKLGTRQERAYTALTVTVDAQPEGWVYLRGTAYTDFDGDSWTLGASTARNPISVLASPWICDELATVKIHTVAQHGVLFTPNNLVDPATSYRPKNVLADYRVPNDDHLRDYSFSMYLRQDSYVGIDGKTLQALREDAYAECLSLPEQTADALRALAEQKGLSGRADPRAQIEAVIAFVEACAEYDLSPERCPADKDFSVWFLSEAKGGYCVHFASSAAAMLRALGIPARYVDGYVTQVEAGQTVQVAERQSHAWVEAFVEGEGWVRFDPTPGAGLERTVLDTTDRPDQPTEATERIDESGGGETIQATEPSTEATEPQETSSPDETTETEAKGVPVWFWIVGGLLLAVLSLWLSVVLRRRRRLSRYAASSGNARALLDWRRYESLCRACDATPDSGLYGLALKAKFSQHTLEREELSRLSAAVSRQERALRGLPLPKRFWVGLRLP